ncbi:MAG: hypothetical protein N3E45_12430 [Oscillatoriaceae bacterium SKW80]|nr:hypothetical protein [Oscillatoriaceae bacterium SKYG93]MCX8121609.1 hypothetical protein [Oscillatoriaceae bacterium SKW80]MDW8453917.1 hypothetical protein [Oscillatoriaceae cyanobacterium SKYGB_i_bin93]HIK28840.1 hypothetical protein [Oscillatoriaceae cyanobacterium M7585_C2015_266]
MKLTNSAINPDYSASEKARYLMLERQRADRNRERSLLVRSAAEVGIDV